MLIYIFINLFVNLLILFLNLLIDLHIYLFKYLIGSFFDVMNNFPKGQLVFSQDESAGYASLYHLLWCCVADDFEIRTKAVTLLIG